MSVALLDRAPGQSASNTGSGPRRSRSTHPIGARFPRRVALDTSASPAINPPVVITNAPIFPVGARFPRRTAADVVRYLAELELHGGPVTTNRPVYPVGARFPLR